MNERDFCYWLQGFFELNNVEEVNKEQVEVIKEHLKLVFTKETKIFISPSLRTFDDVKYTVPQEVKTEVTYLTNPSVVISTGNPFPLAYLKKKDSSKTC